MGCDIHMYAEALVDGKWVPAGGVVVDDIYEDDDEYIALTAKHPYRGRNYSLFSVLAGVRGEGPGIIHQRGIPDDPSELIGQEYDRWGCDAHSAHHYYLSELTENRHRFEAEEDWGDGRKYKVGADFLETIDDLEELAKHCNLEPDEIRVVFWFDN